METSRINYNFIAVPTNLYCSLDCNLRNALTVLLQLSSTFADKEGYFFRTIEDLQKDFKFGKNLTIAAIESLFRYGLLQVKSVGFTKKGCTKQVNFYRINTERFKDFEKNNIYTITNNKELHLDTVNYKEKGFKVTYANSSPTEALNVISRETPSPKCENVPMALKTQNPEAEDIPIVTEVDEDYILDVFGNDITEEWKELVELAKSPIETAIPPTPKDIETR